MQPKLSKTRTIMKADNTEDLGYYNFFSSLYGFIVSILPMKTHMYSEPSPRMNAEDSETLGHYSIFSSLYGFIVSILPMKTHKCSEIGPRKNAGVRSVRDILRQGRSSVPSGAYMVDREALRKARAKVPKGEYHVDREALRKARAKVPKGEYHVDLLQFDLSIKIPTAETCVRSNL